MIRGAQRITMKMIIGVVLFILVQLSAKVKADTFNYHKTSGDNYGPEEWNRVSCSDLDSCPGWPDKHLSSIGWELEQNQCRWCPETGNRCPQQHRMSPVNLVRDRAIEDNPNWKDCPDWHWMNFEDGSCLWDDMEESFEISRHALQIHTPMRNNGDIDCANAEGQRLYPRLDYSKGFPDWWHLDRTDIKVPSEHTQHGKRYSAEVTLAHFYELDHWKNQIGYVTLFMQDYPNEEPWHYLDKLICMWRREEEKQRSKCDLPPAPVYKMCELYRGQKRTTEDMEFDEASASDQLISEESQLDRPSPIPIQNFGGNPDAKLYPLQLCQGDCDLNEDCAPGLICHRRDAFESVPGCLGGEDDKGSSDYCVFDPFGPGYFEPTDQPTLSPSVSTSSPTLTQLPPKEFIELGGSPPVSAYPLQRCVGDCDSDSDCAEGLICFQRGSNEAVPGCIGGEDNPMKTDYCVLDPIGNGYNDPVTSLPTALNTPEQPSVAPIPAPTNLPTTLATVPPVPTAVNSTDTYVSRPSENAKEIWNRGWEPNFLLGECEGDCDNDSDCLTGLVCFNRETALVPVPGCLGGESDPTLTDYCISPPSFDEVDSGIVGRVETKSPTKIPSKTPSKTPRAKEADSRENSGAQVPRLQPISWSPPRAQLPLDLCEGDCDVDTDCGPGLICFQRFTPNTAVPGCLGGETDTSLMDYCIIGEIDEPLPSVPVPTSPAPTPIPTATVPVAISELDTRSDIPPAIDCKEYSSRVKFNRFCDNGHQDSCCQNPRSSSNYCHDNYNIFGDDIYSACYHCCLEENGNAYEVGPSNNIKAGLELYTNEQCAGLDNSARLCKAQSCCDPDYSNTSYCREQRRKYGGDFERICWYCCHPSKEFISDSRLLLEGHALSDDSSIMHKEMTEEEARIWHKNNPRSLNEEDAIFNHTSMHRELIVRKENFVQKGLKDEDAYFENLYEAHKRRQLQTSVKENYDDVFWWPYEWLLKVGTEYYFRYEGSMTVPPCYTVNHWRVMKDPIRVAKHQIKELERLLAWRLNGRCEVSTAGKPRKNDPDAVDVNRPVQELAKGHRMVFCECQDWPSKFPQEREWCKKWQERDPELRLYENPYNWKQPGF